MPTTQRGSKQVIARSILLACILLAWCSCAFALNPALDVNQYAHTAWKIRDGFTKGEISSITQTPDGYLWLGTEFGLLRFDGVRTVPWQPLSDQHLPSSQIFSLITARDGTLWIGTSKGLASWKDGKLTQYPALAEHYIFKILEDHEGTIWASGLTVNSGLLCAIKDGAVQCYGEDGTLGRAFSLYEDSKGNLWAGVQDGLWRWKPGQPKFYPLAGEPNGIQGLGEDSDGTLLVGWNGGVHRFIDGKTYLFQHFIPQLQGRRILRDRDGGLWIGTLGGGLLHIHRERVDAFAAADGLSGEGVNALFEDREGNIWIASRSGLDRFHEFAVATFSINQGLSSAIVHSVLADGDGSVFLATNQGLDRWNNWQIKTIGVRGKLNRFDPRSLFQDSTGRIWVSTPFELGYLENYHFVSLISAPGAVTGMAQDISGNLWIANERAGLFQVFRGSVVQQIPWTKLGHNDHVSVLANDRLRGGLWLGFFLGGIAHFRDGRIEASYTTADGLTGGRVSDFLFDQDGTLWIATEGGLSRLRSGRVTTLTSKNGLPCDAVHWLREDNAHDFWLYTACGLVRIAWAELDALATAVDQNKNAMRTLPASVFDSSDGVKSLASGNHLSPQVAKSSDGRLWFTSPDGLGTVDPSHLPINKLPPSVHIEQLTADRKTYDMISDSSGQLRLPPLSRDLQIDYTALSLVAPEKVRFRYKLEGYDRDWQDGGNRRQAFYTNLPPRDYRFRVMACNNSGVWNETGTFLDFTIASAYYQTAWFRALFVIAVLLVLFALYRLRVQQLAHRVRAGMEGRLDERERIARDLHDTLLQSVQGLILKVHAVSKQITSDPAARDALEKTLDHADQVLAEGRDRVRNLRATATSLYDLPAAFKGVAEETPQGHKATFKTVVEGSLRKLHPVVQEESYCIGREAIINALTHSGGRNVEVEIIYEPRQFRLRVRDDGSGIASNILEEGGRSDHWGMQGMRERANKIGAELKLWSGNGVGTEVELTVPGVTAYRAASGGANRFWTALYKKLIK